MAAPKLISSELGFILFPLQIWFKALTMSPDNSCAKILFPVEIDVPICHQQAWRHVDPSWVKTFKVLLVTPVLEPAIDLLISLFLPSSCPERMRNITCAPDALHYCPRALKSLLIALELLVQIHCCLPEKSVMGNNLKDYRVGSFPSHLQPRTQRGSRLS